MHTSVSHPERDKAMNMLPLERIDPSKGSVFELDYIGWTFERLRRDDPVHLSDSKRYGPYWSVTKYEDIVAVDPDHATDSSGADLVGIVLAERPAPEVFPSFIAMDPPRHDGRTGKCQDYFTRLWNQRVNAEPRNDLISMLAHAPATRHMSPQEYLGNVILLIVGGNDTTRNSISGGLLALNRFPDQYDKLRAIPQLVESLVPEIIRWQTPLAHMRRTALRCATRRSTARPSAKATRW